MQIIWSPFAWLARVGVKRDEIAMLTTRSDLLSELLPNVYSRRGHALGLSQAEPTPN
jgi:hypothetical protein